MRTFNDVMNEISEKENRLSLIRKTVVFISSVTEDLEYRVAYFLDTTEALMWEKSMVKIYDSLEFTYKIYTDIIDN